MIYLHIGTEKTGSTSIQKFIWQQKQLLLSHNFYVPDFLSPNHVHLMLYAAERNACRGLLINQNLYEENAYNHFKSTFPKSFISHLQPQLDKGFNLILTSELFSTRLNKIEQIEKIAQLLQQLKQPIKVIVYLRRQDEYIASSYSTSIQNGRTFDLDTYINKPNMNLDYYSFLNLWAKVFGKENIIVRSFQFQKLLNQDVIQDFLAVIGLIDKLELDFSKYNLFLNPSLDFFTLEFLRLLNYHVPPFINDQYNHKRKEILYFLNEISENSKIKLSRSKAAEIVEKYKNSNDQVSVEYLNKPPGALFSEDDLLNFINSEENQLIFDSAKAVEIAFNLNNKIQGNLVEKQQEMILELEKGKAWLEQERQNLLAEIKRKNERLKFLKLLDLKKLKQILSNKKKTQTTLV